MSHGLPTFDRKAADKATADAILVQVQLLNDKTQALIDLLASRLSPPPVQLADDEATANAIAVENVKALIEGRLAGPPMTGTLAAEVENWAAANWQRWARP